MLKRRLEGQIRADLEDQAAVALLGPRQVGKTTLALAIGEAGPSVYLDLEDPADRDKLAEPALYLAAHEDKLVIIDEIQNAPELFSTLRGLIDKGRRKGRKTGRFLLLGSASIELLRQSSESLAGRIAYRELHPLDITEVGSEKLDALWLRGGFPQSFLARGDARSLDWRRDFLRTYLTRDIPLLEPRIPAEALRRLWTMLAHNHGTPLNASRLATGLSVSAPTVVRYIDLLVDLLLVRRLVPFHANLSTAWQSGEVRPTSQAKPKAKRGRRRPDPLAAVTGELRAWFDADPSRTARELLARLNTTHSGDPDGYPDAVLRTLQRRLKGWRAEMAQALVFGRTERSVENKPASQ